MSPSEEYLAQQRAEQRAVDVQRIMADLAVTREAERVEDAKAWAVVVFLVSLTVVGCGIAALFLSGVMTP